jgi:hypothetical protein
MDLFGCAPDAESRMVLLAEKARSDSYSSTPRATLRGRGAKALCLGLDLFAVNG